MKKILVLLLLFTGTQLFAERDYNADITPYKADIDYVITTLGTTGAMGLMFKKGELEKRGNQTAPVHPLAYLGYVFSNPQLKHLVGKMSRPAWSRWKSDFAKSLEKASERGNMKEAYIADFSKKVGISEAKIKPLIEQKKWNQFIDLLVKNAN